MYLNVYEQPKDFIQHCNNKDLFILSYTPPLILSVAAEPSYYRVEMSQGTGFLLNTA